MYHVQVYFADGWGTMTQCQTFAEAEASIAYWRSRSCWRFRIVKE